MLTQYETEKLKREMQNELDAEQGALWKCAVGILIIVGMAFFGTGPAEQRDIAAYTSNGQASGGGGR